MRSISRPSSVRATSVRLVQFPARLGGVWTSSSSRGAIKCRVSRSRPSDPMTFMNAASSDALRNTIGVLLSSQGPVPRSARAKTATVADREPELHAARLRTRCALDPVAPDDLGEGIPSTNICPLSQTTPPTTFTDVTSGNGGAS